MTPCGPSLPRASPAAIHPIKRCARSCAAPASVIASPTAAPSLEIHAEAESVEIRDDARLSVSSTKYTQPLLDTPQTVTVISKEVIEEQGATTLRDVLKNVPGLTITAGE